MKRPVIVGVAAVLAASAGWAISGTASSDAPSNTFVIPIDQTVTNPDGSSLHLTGSLTADVTTTVAPPPPVPPPPPPPDPPPPPPPVPPPPPPPPPPVCTVTYSGGGLTAFVTALNPGDTGCVPAGTYTEQMRCDSGGTAAGQITVKGLPGAVLTSSADGVVRFGCDYVTVTGFDIAGPSTAVGGTNVFFSSGTHDVLEGNTIHGAVCSGIYVSEQTVFAVIRNNTIRDNGIPPCDRQAHGIYIEGTDNQAVGNTISNSPEGFGVQIGDKSVRTIVTDNTIDRSGQSGCCGGIVLWANGTRDVRVDRNHITNSQNLAIRNLSVGSCLSVSNNSLGGNGMSSSWPAGCVVAGNIP